MCIPKHININVYIYMRVYLKHFAGELYIYYITLHNLRNVINIHDSNSIEIEFGFTRFLYNINVH